MIQVHRVLQLNWIEKREKTKVNDKSFLEISISLEF